MRGKKPLFWAGLVLGNLLVLELCLSSYHFQRHASSSFAIVHYWNVLRNAVYRRVLPVGIWERDPVFGYAHRPLARGRHKTVDYDVTYTIDEHGNRHIPAAEGAEGRILFLGGSFAFGQGVEDDETFPYLLSLAWPDRQVVNRAVMGWGTAHAYLALSQELEAERAPSMVIYSMIPYHIERNYLRRSWIRMISEFERDHPHFELADGKPVFRGVVGGDAGLENSPQLRLRELELTRALLVDMADKCRERGIPFLVLLLQEPPPYYIAGTLAERGITVLDLTELRIEGFRADLHPNRDDHRRIAEAVARMLQPRSMAGRNKSEPSAR